MLLPGLKHLSKHVSDLLFAPSRPPEVEREQNFAPEQPLRKGVWGWQLCPLAKVLPAGRRGPVGALMGKEEEPGKGAACCETQITAPVSELLQQSPFSWGVPSPLRCWPSCPGTGGEHLGPGAAVPYGHLSHNRTLTG